MSVSNACAEEAVVRCGVRALPHAHRCSLPGRDVRYGRSPFCCHCWAVLMWCESDTWNKQLLYLSHPPDHHQSNRRWLSRNGE